MRKMKTNATVNPSNAAYVTAVLPKVANPQPSPVKRVKEWWGKHFGTPQARKNTVKAIGISINNAILSFARAMKVNLLLALVAMLVVQFCPQIGEVCPVFLQLCFTLLKVIFQTITLDWASAGDSMSALLAEGGRLISMLIDWLQSITF